MSEHLAWQMLVSRWLILFAAAFGTAVILNGIAAAFKKDVESYKGKTLWWVAFLVLGGGHVAGFLYRHSLPHWILCVAAGFFVGVGATVLLKMVSVWLKVSLAWAYAFISSAAFAIIANFTPLEKMLIDFLRSL